MDVAGVPLQRRSALQSPSELRFCFLATLLPCSLASSPDLLVDTISNNMASHGSAPELIHQRGSRAEYGQGLEVDHSNEGLQYRSGPETLPLTEKHAGYSGGYVNGDSTTSRSRTSRNPCDLSPLIFALLVATITAIIVGAAVGGGVGGALSNKSSR